MNKIKTVLLAALAAVLALTACGSSGPQQPGSWGPTVDGQTYCAYMVSPLECVGQPGIPVQMPMAQPAGYYYGAPGLLNQLFMWHLLYGGWYGSSRYYNHYVPVSYRSTYVHNYVTVFNHNYGGMSRTTRSQYRSNTQQRNGGTTRTGGGSTYKAPRSGGYSGGGFKSGGGRR